MENSKLIKKKKQQLKEKMEKISKAENVEKRISLYNELLKISNTNRDLILYYLQHVTDIYKTKEELLNSELAMSDFRHFINYFPPKEWNDKYSYIIEKKNSSIEKLNLVLQKILSQNWLDANHKDMKGILEFFRENIKTYKNEINNSSPITWENDELFIYYLFKEFLGQIQSKIIYYSEETQFINITNKEFLECKSKIEKLENEIMKLKSENEKDKLKQELEKLKNEKISLGVCEGDFFKKYLNNFSNYLLTIKDTYLKDLTQKKFDKKEDQDMFEYFMLYITNYDFEAMVEYMYDVWKYSFQNLKPDEKNQIFESYKNLKKFSEIKIENDNVLKIVTSKNSIIKIENYEDYELQSLLISLIKYGIFEENKFIDIVKITKLNKHLYIKKIMPKWVNYNITIFNSNVIKNLFNELFPKDKRDDTILTEEELKIILENIIYYIFPTSFSGLTMRSTMKIYIQGTMINSTNEDASKVITLAYSLVCNQHEILGNFNIGYQIYSNPNEKKIFESPEINSLLSSDFAKKRGNKELEENIEIKLFGRVIDFLTLKEALFILNPKNYKSDLVTFRENFKKCNQDEINIDEEFEVILKNDFNININNIPKNENYKHSITEITKKNTEQSTYTIKGKHPISFDFDGAKFDNCDSITKLISALEQPEGKKDLPNNNSLDKMNDK